MAEAGEQGMARQTWNRRYSTAGRQVKLAGLWSRSVWVWRECGGAGRSEGGLGPTLLSPPNLSPLPVSVLAPSRLKLLLYGAQFLVLNSLFIGFSVSVCVRACVCVCLGACLPK